MGTLKAKVAGVWTPVSGNGQSAADTARWNSAWGQQVRSTKAVTEGGFSSTEYVISGLNMVAPAVTGRMQQVEFSLRFIPTALPAANNSVVVVNLRQGTTISGTLIASVQFPFPTHSTPYGWNLTGLFPPTSLVSGTTYCLTTSTDGLGTYQITNASWDAVMDLGPTILVAIAPPSASPRVVASGNALGIIGMGSFIPPLAPRTIAVNTETALTYPLPFFAAVGRRYRVRFQARALVNSAGAGNTSFYLRDNGTNIRGTPFGGDPYIWSQGAYTGVAFDWLFDGDGLQHSLELLCNGVAMSIYVDYGLWYVEDVGPTTSPALPIPETPPPWTQVTLVNGWLWQGAPQGVPSYRKIGDMVQLSGTLRNDGANTMRTTAFTLPVGFRPPYPVNIAFIGGLFSPANLNVQPSGNVSPQSAASLDANTPQTFVPLSGMSFSTTP